MNRLRIVLCCRSWPFLPRQRGLVINGRLHHLRQGNQREWSDFPEQAEGPSLAVRFQAEANAAEQTLRLRQQDVKQTWKVLLNGKELRPPAARRERPGHLSARSARRRW